MNDSAPKLVPIERVLPLAGVRVARLGASRVGRFLRHLLEGQGADFITREAVAADAAVAAADAVDPGIDPGADPAIDPAIDVVIDDRAGDDAAQDDVVRWHAANSRGISLKLVDFPKKHPAWSGRSALVDEVIHAELGLNRLTPGSALRPEPLAIATSYGAIWSALYVTAALRQRQVQGRGCHVELPLFSAAVTVMGRRLVTADDPKLVDPLEQPHLPVAEIYACADGRYVQNHGMFWPFAEITCRAFGRDDWVAEAVAGMDVLPDRATEQIWRERFAGEFRRRPAREWEQRFAELLGACTACRTREEWIAEAHPHATGMFASRAPATVGAGVTVRAAVAPASRPGAADAAVPASAGTAGPAAASRSRRGEAGAAWHAPQGEDRALPLAGIRVVDLSIILAGPTCGRTLAELGADVIKIDAADRTISPFGWLDVNRAKRSLLLNIKTPAGAEILRRLVLSCDVLLQNLRLGKLEKLGFGYDELRRVRPDLVYAMLNAFDYGGPWEARPGWEHNAQAGSGMQVARAVDGVPQQVPVPVNDFATGLFGAWGVLMALRRRDETGEGALVTGSLSRTATFVQGDEYAGRTPEGPPTRALACRDGWVRVVDDAALQRAGVDPAALSGATSAEAAQALRARGVVAVVERTVAEVTRGNWLDETGLRVAWRHRHLGGIRQMSAAASVQGVPKRSGWPASDRGDDTDAVLADLGFGRDEIAALHAQGVVHGRVPTF